MSAQGPVSGTIPPPPARLRDEPFLQRTLELLLHKIEAGVKQVKVNPNQFPELFDYQNPDARFLWSLVEQLDHQHHLLTIQYGKRTRQQEPYESAKLRIASSSEPILRAWLQRPARDGYTLLWRALLERFAPFFDDGGAALSQTPIRVSGKSAEDVIRGFVRAGELLRAPVTLRQLSASAFWGHSKFLDGHERLLHSLFAERIQHLQQRPILLNVALPAVLRQVLLVENQDTFLGLSRAPPPETALVYSGGFRGASGRSRLPGGAVFSYLAGADHGTGAQFETWWRCGEPPLNCAFWGDLDWAGMAILQRLRQSFPEMTAWRPGYERLVQVVRGGGGHELQIAGKAGQLVVAQTGDPYADEVLLPCLAECGRGVDQEWLD